MKLSEYLAENGISQRFFSSKINYSIQYVNSIVKGRRKPSKQFIKAVNDYIQSHQRYTTSNIPHLEWGSLENEDDQR